MHVLVLKLMKENYIMNMHAGLCENNKLERSCGEHSFSTVIFSTKCQFSSVFFSFHTC